MKNFRLILLINGCIASAVFATEPSPALPALPASNIAPTPTPPPAAIVINEISLEQATKQVANAIAGRVLSAKTEDTEGKRLHVIKILTADGRIQQQIIDVNTGAIVDMEEKQVLSEKPGQQ